MIYITTIFYKVFTKMHCRLFKVVNVKNAAIMLFVLLLPVSWSEAKVTEGMIQRYERSALEQYDTESTLAIFTAESEANPEDPAARFFTGASKLLMANEVWSPFSKLAYLEDGLMLIDSALNSSQLPTLDTSYNDFPLPLYVTINAAIIYCRIPKSFGYQEKGLNLLDKSMQSQSFLNLPLKNRTWVYFYAIESNISAGHKDKAMRLLDVLNRIGIDDEYVKNANKLTNI